MVGIHDVILRSDILKEISQRVPYYYRSEEQLFREYVITRDPRAYEYGMYRFSPNHVGVLNRDPHIQWTFMAVAAITNLTRMCMDGGMPELRAYTISDMFLQQLTLTETKEELIGWYSRALRMFLSLMPPLEGTETKGGEQYSKYVAQAVDYCAGHPEQPLSVSQVAQKLFINPDYLSKRFHRETGITFSKFVKKIKIEAAKELIRSGQLGLLEIAVKLGFSSQSYFIKCFKDETGITPGQYEKSLQTVF